MSQIKVEGTVELARLLNRAARSLTKKEMNEILKSSSGHMVQKAKQDASRINPSQTTYTGSRSGRAFTLKAGVIKRSIKTKSLKTKDAVLIVAPIYTRNANTDPWFAHFVHEGTAVRRYKGMSRGRIKRPIAFMAAAGSSTNRELARRKIIRGMTEKLNQMGLGVQ